MDDVGDEDLMTIDQADASSIEDAIGMLFPEADVGSGEPEADYLQMPSPSAGDEKQQHIDQMAAIVDGCYTTMDVTTAATSSGTAVPQHQPPPPPPPPPPPLPQQQQQKQRRPQQQQRKPSRGASQDGGAGGAGSAGSRRSSLEHRSATSIRELARQRWLKAEEALDVLEHPSDYGLQPEAKVVSQPGEGALFLFNRVVLRGFRLDGHDYRKKNHGRQLDETHCKLKVDGAARLVCYYSWLADGSLARRIYTLLDDKELALVHYFRQEPAKPQNLQQPAMPTAATAGGPPLAAGDPASSAAAAASASAESASAAASASAESASAESASAESASAQARIATLEERIRWLELENAALKRQQDPPPPPPPLLPAGDEVSADVSAGAGTVPPAMGAGPSGAGPLGAGPLGAGPLGAPPLAVLDMSPSWDAVGGGGRVLVAALTQPGVRYGASFGLSRTAVAPATLVLPNVLSIVVPPSATGASGAVPFRLFRLSPEGEILEMASSSYPFHYREPLRLGGFPSGKNILDGSAAAAEAMLSAPGGGPGGGGGGSGRRRRRR